MAARHCQTLTVAARRRLSPDGGLFFLDIEAPDWKGFTPGQFVMLRPPESGAASWGELTWARPISICLLEKGRLTLMVQVAGRGTALLARLAPGDRVDVWGPLGNGFATAGPALLLAGGVGLAPFVGYARGHEDPASLSLVFGHRAPAESFEAVWELMPPGVGVTTFHETAPEDIPRFVALLDERVARSEHPLRACGPGPFLATVQRQALAHGKACQLSLENKMACGVGACLGCVTRTETPGGPRRVQACTAGPVFDAAKITLGEG